MPQNCTQDQYKYKAGDFTSNLSAKLPDGQKTPVVMQEFKYYSLFLCSDSCSYLNSY